METPRRRPTTSRPPRRSFCLGIAAQLISQAGFIFVALALYELFKGVNRRHASLMVTFLVVVQIPIAFRNELELLLCPRHWCAGLTSYPYSKSLSERFWRCCSSICILRELWSPKYFAGPVASSPRAAGIHVAIPAARFLGVWLVIDGFGYVILSLTTILLPQYQDKVSTISQPAFFGEVAFMLWLLIKGGKPRRSDGSHSVIDVGYQVPDRLGLHFSDWLQSVILAELLRPPKCTGVAANRRK